MPKAFEKRSRLLVMWDFQNLGVPAWEVPQVNAWIRKELDTRFPATSYQRFKAFSHPSQSAAVDVLQDSGWRAWEDTEDMDEEMDNQSRSDCGQDPKDTILVLVTRDGDFVELVNDLKTEGVLVYLISPTDVNRKLMNAFGGNQWIPMNAGHHPRIIGALPNALRLQKTP